MPTCPCGRTFNQHPLDPRPYLLCPVCRNQVPWERAGRGVTWGQAPEQSPEPAPDPGLKPAQARLSRPGPEPGFQGSGCG